MLLLSSVVQHFIRVAPDAEESSSRPRHSGDRDTWRGRSTTRWGDKIRCACMVVRGLPRYDKYYAWFLDWNTSFEMSLSKLSENHMIGLFFFKWLFIYPQFKQICVVNYRPKRWLFLSRGRWLVTNHHHRPAWAHHWCTSCTSSEVISN